MFMLVPTLTDLNAQLYRIGRLACECRALAKDAVPEMNPARREDLGAQLSEVEETLDGLFD